MKQSKIDGIRNLFHIYICLCLLYIAMSLGKNDLAQWTKDAKLIGLPLLSALGGFFPSLFWEGFWEWKVKAPFSWSDIRNGTIAGCIGGVLGLYLPGPIWLLILLFLGVVYLLGREYKLRKDLLK